ncbi:hypothetical protein MNBD_BACTEROID03-324 [hydrothermal vent metagenome]|uniref:6-phosphogluconolactonase n=1 Tax=hydrothermal vent metagenome TaxID=652676 RepID=A0A3B0T3S5_9ZZZZ
MKNYKPIAILCFFFIFGSCQDQDSRPLKTYSLFVGTYTDNGSEGIYKYTFDSGTGALTDKTLAASLKTPSFLKISSNKKKPLCSRGD